jgi:hypothetical protein
MHDFLTSAPSSARRVTTAHALIVCQFFCGDMEPLYPSEVIFAAFYFSRFAAGVDA